MELTLQDFANFYCCSLRTAQTRAKEIRNFFGLPKGKRVLRFHLARYEGLTMIDLDIILKGM